MKNLFALFALIVVLYSCDDGDFIVTDFDFDEIDLQSCPEDFSNEENNEFIFFQINDQDEAIALNFTTSLNFFRPERVEDIEDVFDFELSSSDSVIYRKFDESITSDYFCSSLPPSSPNIIEELISTDGIVNIRTAGIFMDEDGIPSQLEDPENFDSDDSNTMKDTDEDGIPDIIDFDDDGDNIPTILEGVVFLEDDDGNIIEDEDGNMIIDIVNSRDTDEDGILDYLDNDDDDDGILTINEDSNGDLNPLNDIFDPSINLEPDYRNEAISVDHEINEFRIHTYLFTDITISISLENLIFRDENGEQETRISSDLPLDTYNAANVEKTETPIFN